MAATGVVKGLSAVTTVTIQTTRGRTWRHAATTTVRTSGRYTANLSLTDAGRTDVRAVATGRNTLISPIVTLTAG